MQPYFSELRQKFETYLQSEFALFATSPACASILEAAHYSLFGGGKRIRALLILLTAKAVHLDMQRALPFAAALEMIHCYSLIHDDLPSLDNDDLRRGQASCHKRFGEAVAILAGDLLLTTALEILIREAGKGAAEQQAAATIAKAAGARGMIAGQALDIASTCSNLPNKELMLSQLVQLQNLKTSALFVAALLAPAQLAGENALYAQLDELGQNLGLAFQIRDDLLDEIGSVAEMGKSIGKDKQQNKLTFVSLLGKQAATELLASYESKQREICAHLRRQTYDAAALAELLLQIQGRRH